MFCGQCGEQIGDNASVCEKCGWKVPASEEKPKKKKTGLVVAIILLLLLIIAAVVFYLFWNSEEQKFNRMLKTAEEFMDDEEYEDAIDVLEEALNIEEDDEDVIEMLVEAYTAVAEEYEDDEEYSKAEKYWKKIAKLEGTSDEDEDSEDGNSYMDYVEASRRSVDISMMDSIMCTLEVIAVDPSIDWDIEEIVSVKFGKDGSHYECDNQEIIGYMCDILAEEDATVSDWADGVEIWAEKGSDGRVTFTTSMDMEEIAEVAPSFVYRFSQQ